MTGPQILFICDAGAATGGGHVMRSLTLAGALEAKGAHCVFLAPPSVAAILEAFAPQTVQIPAVSTQPADLASAVGAMRFDGVVFDHYGLSQPDHRALSAGAPALAFDDLADRPLGAELVVDSGPARTAQDYDALIPEGARLLLGPAYAPVRPEFAALRDTALAWRDEPVGRVLVSLGLTDVGGITGRVVERVRPRVSEVGIDVVLGGAAPSLPSLAKIARRDLRLALHVDTPHMARLTAEADIAVGACGSSTWERCALGLPSVMVVLADNQRPAAAAMAALGAALVVDAEAPDFDVVLDRALMRLLTDQGLRRQLTERSAGLCDGQGAPRVAEAFLQLIAVRAAK
jgi:UDP-2,4-diacetamido-2,4,6-trideoxy-beta-L-altropyranose hydrolase